MAGKYLLLGLAKKRNREEKSSVKIFLNLIAPPLHILCPHKGLVNESEIFQRWIISSTLKTGFINGKLKCDLLKRDI